MWNLFHHLDIIRKRPGMYIWSNKISDLRTYIAWYGGCLLEKEIIEKESDVFDELHDWVAEFYGYEKSAKWWPTIIQEQTKTEEEALQLFFELLDKFKSENWIK